MPSPTPSPEQEPEEEEATGKQPPDEDTTASSNHDTVIPRHHDTTDSSFEDIDLEAIRKALKSYGKEAATHRFTLPEKKALAEIIYRFKIQGIRTNENEITRIAVNYLVKDYKEHKEDSILDGVLELLNE